MAKTGQYSICHIINNPDLSDRPNFYRGLVGIFTERDALRVLASGGNLDSPIESLMARNPVTVRETDSVETAIGKMSANGYRRLPVVDSQGRATGILDACGVIHWLVDHFPSAVYNLPPVAKPGTLQREGP